MGIPHFAPDGYHGGMIDETAIRDRFEAMRVRLDERERRLFAAAEARSAGYGGVSAVARATGIARSTIDRGLKELAAPDRAGSKVRRSGGGRPALTRADPTLLEDLRGLLESTTLGDPTRPLMWVSKSHAKLALALEGLGHRVSATRIPQLLERLGYRRQVNRKSLEGGHHVDRNAQFEYINAQVAAFQAAGQPVISVDTKKKELIGPYKNGGSDYRPQGYPINLNVGKITGGDWPSSVPAWCTFDVRISVYPGQSIAEAKAEIEQTILAAAQKNRFLANYPPQIVYHGFEAEGYVLSGAEEPVAALGACHRTVFGRELEEMATSFTTDARFFGLYADIPALVYGPNTEAIHGFDEKVDLESLRRITQRNRWRFSSPSGADWTSDRALQGLEPGSSMPRSTRCRRSSS